MATPNATTPAPWPAAAYPALLTTPAVSPTWDVTLHHAGTTLTINAWDITVELDTNRIPYATAQLTIPDTTTLPSLATPIAIRIRTGWTTPTGLATLFTGLVDRWETNPAGGLTLHAESAETYFDHPLAGSAPWDDPTDPWLTIHNTVADIITDPSFTMLRKPTLIADGLITTTTDQRTALRTTACARGGDNLDDLIHNLALALGQRARGDHRDRAGLWPTPWAYRILGPTTSYTPIDLRPIATDIRRHSDITTLINWVSGTVTSDDPNTGDPTDTGFTVLDPTADTGTTTLIRHHELPRNTVRGYYGPHTHPIAARWLKPTPPITETATTRALWWLEPGHWANITGTPREITRLTYQIDPGLMTLTATT